jgi:hypothetical protein
MPASVQAGEGLQVVLSSGCANDDGIDRLVCQKFVETCRNPRSRPTFGSQLNRHGRLRIKQGNDFAPTILLHSFAVMSTHSTTANQRKSNWRKRPLQLS